jgi:hypothetical protein|tara:strand:- start:570 stop:1076 length:507 start_codon:yes stop_codon:yes gene_type:complete
MNIVIFTLIIFIIVYFLLKYIGNAPTKKISNSLRFFTIISLILLIILLTFTGKLLLSLPFAILSLALVKLKGLSLFQLIALFRLIQTLRRSGRFNFSKNQTNNNSSALTIEEAHKILNLDINNKVTKEDVNKAYIKIQKKIHPDVSPETSRLSMIVNEAKEILLKNIE